MIKRYGASVSPCSTPATMSKYSVSPSGECTFNKSRTDCPMNGLCNLGNVVYQAIINPKENM